VAEGRWSRRTGLVAVAGLLAALASPQAAEAAPRRILSGWIPYWSTSASLATFNAQADLFSDISPFWHSATGDTTIADQETSADRAAVLGAAQAAGVPVLASVTDGTPAGYMAGVLADPGRRAAHINALVSLASARGYQGIDLDYEGFAFRDGKASWAATRPNWVAFVQQLGAALHAQGRLLSVTVPPTYDSLQGSGSGYWVYDYAGIAPSIDRLRIMAYDYSVSAAGPIAPISWVDRVAKYAVTQVPPLKIQLGIPTYGRSWVTGVAGACPTSADTQTRGVTAQQALSLAQQRGIPVIWDAAVQEQTYAYATGYTGTDANGVATSCTVTRTVWFDGAPAVQARAALVNKYLLGGASLWTVGGEDPGQWGYLRTLASGAIQPAPFTPFGALDVVSAGTGQVRVAGWGIDPDTVSPIDVHVYVDGSGYAFTAAGSRPDVAGVYPGYGAAHGFDVVVPSAAGAHRVCAYLINVGVGGNALLGCRDVVVGSASPFGALDAVSAGPGSVAVGGWAIDPNTQEPIDVHVYVGAAGYAVRADGSRPDVGAVYPGFGPAHGFSASLPAAAGPQRVCVYGINTGPGANTLIGCRDVVVPAT
jgi:spore germination protein YaaH